MDIEKVIMETHANTAFVMLGFVAVPLWLSEITFETLIFLTFNSEILLHSLNIKSIFYS